MARKKKVSAPVVEEQIIEVAQEQVVEQVAQPVKEEKPTPTITYKCMECGLLNEVTRCKRCGSSIYRIVR